MQRRELCEQKIKLAALDVPEGTTSRAVQCPWCESKDGSFSVTRAVAGLWYHCFKVTCAKAGFISSMPCELWEGDVERTFVPKRFKHSTVMLPIGIRAWLKQSYRLSDADIDNNGFKYVPDDNRLYIPITTWEGYMAGVVTKRLPDKFSTTGPSTGRKSIVYWEVDAVPLYFPAGEILTDGPIVIVEDQLSAARVRQFTSSVALLGTTFTDESAAFLAARYRHVIMALDADTWQGRQSLGLKYKSKYGLFFRKFGVKHITKDPKDMTDAELAGQILVQ